MFIMGPAANTGRETQRNAIIKINRPKDISTNIIIFIEANRKEFVDCLVISTGYVFRAIV